MNNIVKKGIVTLGVASTLLLGGTVKLPTGDNMMYVKSYETYLYDTPDGELGNGYYSITDSGYYIIQEKSKDEGGVTLYENYDVTGMTLANKIGKATYSEYYSKKEGRVYREKINNTDYWKAKEKGYKTPEKKEKETLLEMVTPIAEASIVKDITSSSTCSACTSLSFAHVNNGGTGNVIVLTAGTFSAAFDGIDNVTYNGDLLSSTNGAGSGSIATTIYNSITPMATGSNTIVATFTGTLDFAVVSVTSYTGVYSVNSGSSNIKTGFSKNAGSTCQSSQYTGWLVDSMTKYNTTEAMTPGSSQTTIDNVPVGAGFGIIHGSSYMANVSGVKDFSWNWTTTDRDWADVCAYLYPIEYEPQRTNIKGNINIQGKVNI